MLIFWSCSQRVRAYQQVKDTCLVRPDSSVIRASGICLEGPGFNPWSGCLFCLTERAGPGAGEKAVTAAAAAQQDGGDLTGSD
jgi:hypothetical protein